MKNIYLYSIVIYLLIGFIFWYIDLGYAEGASLKEHIFAFFYIVLLWPIIILFYIIQNLIR